MNRALLNFGEFRLQREYKSFCRWRRDNDFQLKYNDKIDLRYSKKLPLPVCKSSNSYLLLRGKNTVGVANVNGLFLRGSR